MNLRQYIGNVFISFDRLCNAILLGDPSETISSRMGRHLLDGSNCRVCKFTCRLLDYFWPNHCINNIEKRRN